MAAEARVVEAPAGVRELLGAVELCVSEESTRPSVVGWRRLRVLLPAGMLEELTEGELRQVVLHEMEHVRRGDQWTNLLQKAAVAAMPLSPAAMWVERRLCLERELACDDGVVRVGAGRKAYAACLARLAEHSAAASRLGRGAVLALGAWERQTELGRRVRRLLRGPERGLTGWRARAVVVAMAGGVVVGGVGMVESPRLVTFGPTAVAEVAASRPMGAGVVGAAGAGRMVLASARLPVRGATASSGECVGRAEAVAARAATTGRPAVRRVAGRVGSREAVRAREVRRVVARRVGRQGWVVLTSFEAGGGRGRLGRRCRWWMRDCFRTRLCR